MNDHRAFWKELLQVLEEGQACVLMLVTASLGSSPGRAGFSMFVSSGGRMHGSIGGGSMEHKLVELARSLMDQPAQFPFLKKQVHRESEARDRSGMICSGEQTVAFYLLTADHVSLVQRIAACEDPAASLSFLPDGIELRTTAPARDAWYTARMDTRPCIAIVGGGHVGVALSRTMRQLGFLVLQFDHRADLNTMVGNEWAHEKHVVDFTRIEEHIPEDPGLFIALVSHGYRTDELALRRLIRRRWNYLGMLGSQAKVETMWRKLKADGFSEEELARVHAPIGIPIHSRTPEEIAVSIAAEIIRVKNT